MGGGVSLTYGQIVALAGDEFGTLEELMSATKTDEGRAMIRAHLERASIAGTAGPLLPAPTADQRAQAKSQYIALAMNNAPHFAGGGTAVATWLEKHTAAVDLALQSGITRTDGLMDQAYLTEAFGDHFLTDAFSSGHIRVPRQEIEAYYVNQFAPMVFRSLLDNLRERLVDEIYDQVDAQTSLDELAYVGGLPIGLGLRAEFKRRIRAEVNSQIAQGLEKAGGRGPVVIMFGQALAGIICGAMHDAENRNGLKVVSNMDADPWVAYGDSDLDKNPQHRAYVEEAVRTAVADLDKARSIGLDEGQALFNLVDPTFVPACVYFGFDQDTLSPEASATVGMVAQYLQYHPSTEVSIVGHTDQVGEAPYNENLGLRRAERVRLQLTSLGLDADRIRIESMGERVPVSHDQANYHLNRRVTFAYATGVQQADKTPEDVGIDHARRRAVNEIGPPYQAESHFPRPAENENEALPNWHWADLSPSFQAEMNKWVSHYVDEYAADALADKALDDKVIATPIGDFTISPRPIAHRVVAEISADPVRFLGRMMGRVAGS
ncbi:outer membrane protein OmpA-like peptidoglycan-associated protein [Arthrobacter sp. B3I9]|nr:outer membrane protein OmpA-like peptidoglycan-associated protein [Arthrobacter sp. B3I9]